MHELDWITWFAGKDNLIRKASNLYYFKNSFVQHRNYLLFVFYVSMKLRDLESRAEEADETFVQIMQPVAVSLLSKFLLKEASYEVKVLLSKRTRVHAQ